jgi:CheY-like chemotaxis protein
LAASSSTASRKADQARILVVDDQDYVRDLLRDILESEGCGVYLAASGREALTMIASQKFHAIFTDVGMPGMSGWELAQAIRQQNEEIPIAVITGWGEAVGSNDQRKAGVDWIVTKPFTAERIAELAQQIKKQSCVGTRRDTRTTAAA